MWKLRERLQNEKKWFIRVSCAACVLVDLRLSIFLAANY